MIRFFEFFAGIWQRAMSGATRKRQRSEQAANSDNIAEELNSEIKSQRKKRKNESGEGVQTTHTEEQNTGMCVCFRFVYSVCCLLFCLFFTTARSCVLFEFATPNNTHNTMNRDTSRTKHTG